MTPGEQLRAWRHKRKLSIERAAGFAGVSPETWRTAELGGLVIKITAERLLDATGVACEVRSDQKRASQGKSGHAIRMWRIHRGLTQRAMAALVGCSTQPIRVVEQGGHVTPDTGRLLLAATGIQVPTDDKRAECCGWASRGASEAQAPSKQRICSTCCGLAHRRPQSKPCRCGESWAPDVVQHPVPGLRSSASWCGDYADAGDSE